MRAIRCIVLERLGSWKKADSGVLNKIKHLISCLVKAAMTLPNKATREKIAVFLSNIILQNETYAILEDVLQEWVVHLPLTLLQSEISVPLMKTLLRLGTHNNEQFLNGIRSKRKLITDNLKVVNIPDSLNEQMDRKKLNDILYWMDPIMECV